MPGYFQQTIIIGAVGRDAEMRTTNGGKQVASFSVAVTERWRDANGKGNSNDGQHNEKTTWYTCTAWEKQAEVVENLVKKGQNIMVIGTVSARGYMGNDNQPRASLDLRIQSFKLLGNRGGNGGAGAYAEDDEYDGHPAYGGSSRDVDDIPF